MSATRRHLVAIATIGVQSRRVATPGQVAALRALRDIAAKVRDDHMAVSDKATRWWKDLTSLFAAIDEGDSSLGLSSQIETARGLRQAMPARMGAPPGWSGSEPVSSSKLGFGFRLIEL